MSFFSAPNKSAPMIERKVEKYRDLPRITLHVAVDVSKSILTKDDVGDVVPVTVVVKLTAV